MKDYAGLRNNFLCSATSLLSPYIHFGQISPLYIMMEVLKSDYSKDEFIEQLIIRRELAVNFVHYNPQYDSLEALPVWARNTLDEHRHDSRKYIYTHNQLENCETHDLAWNDAQAKMIETGFMHNYMRMYWGKKIIEWSETPEEAYRTMLYLNNKYQLDGRDVNSYAGILWCFGKHDRPWGERAVFGKVRYMNENSLRKWGKSNNCT